MLSRMIDVFHEEKIGEFLSNKKFCVSKIFSFLLSYILWLQYHKNQFLDYQEMPKSSDESQVDKKFMFIANVIL